MVELILVTAMCSLDRVCACGAEILSPFFFYVSWSGDSLNATEELHLSLLISLLSLLKVKAMQHLCLPDMEIDYHGK